MQAFEHLLHGRAQLVVKTIAGYPGRVAANIGTLLHAEK